MAQVIYEVPIQYDEIKNLIVIVISALIVRYLLVSLTTVFAHIAAFRILHQLRMELAQKLSGVPLSFFSHRTSGEIKKTMMDDVNQIEAYVAHHFPDGIAAFVIPILTTILLILVDWRMALASIAMAPLAFGAMAIAMRGVSENHRRWYENQERMNSSILEYFRGIQVIKTFGLSASKFGDLSRSIEDSLVWMEKYMKTNGRGFGAFGAIIGASLVPILPLGGWFYFSGSLSLENFVLFLVLGPQVLMGMMRLMFASGNIDRIRQGLERIGSILNADSLVEAANPQIPESNSITFNKVGFAYESDGPDILKDISVNMPEGTVTALVGPSGAGKTTLARLVPRLWDTSSGSVLIGGIDIKNIPIDNLLSRISFVFQDVFLFYGTVMDNLKLGKNDATEEEVISACKMAQAHDFIMGLPQGYATMLGERGARLSGGEKQRLSIARALLKNAPILILDEATSSSDPENEAKIQDALSELCRGRTVLVIAHRLSTITSVDQIIVMEKGRVQSTGTHEELLQKSQLYLSLWKNHTSALEWAMGQTAGGAQ
jgi:ATP-binding cassette subfamily B protein